MAVDMPNTSTGHMPFLASENYGTLGSDKKSAHFQAAYGVMHEMLVVSNLYNDKPSAVPSAMMMNPDIKQAFIKPNEFLKKRKEVIDGVEKMIPKRPRWIILQGFVMMLKSYVLHKDAQMEVMNQPASGYGVGFQIKDGGADRLCDFLCNLDNQAFLKYLEEYEPEYVPAYHNRDYELLSRLIEIRCGDVKYFDFSQNHVTNTLYHLARYARYNNIGNKPGSWTEQQFVLNTLLANVSQNDSFNLIDICGDENKVMITEQVGSGAQTTSDMDHWNHRFQSRMVENRVFQKTLPLATPKQRAAMNAFGFRRTNFGDDKVEAILRICSSLITYQDFNDTMYQLFEIVIEGGEPLELFFKDGRSVQLIL
jgi:hypothetical protein